MENKGVLLTFHYRNVPPHCRERLVTRARQLIVAAGFNIGNAHCALEVNRKLPPFLFYLLINLSVEQAPCSLGQGQGQHLHPEDSIRSGLESESQDHLRWRRQHG